MIRFRRQPAPDFWAGKDAQWRERGPSFPKVDPLNAWKYEKRALSAWFHELVRALGEPRMCAYCDGSLKEQSRETIDHFLPEHAFPELTLAWENLYPACDRCNSTYKRERWSCQLVRPDIEPVESYFDFDEETGRLRPSLSLDWPTRVKVRLTIRIFRLNEEHRCKGRLRVLKEMRNAWKQDPVTLEDRAAHGPYRFVARRFLEAMRELKK